MIPPVPDRYCPRCEFAAHAGPCTVPPCSACGHYGRFLHRGETLPDDVAACTCRCHGVWRMFHDGAELTAGTR